MLSTWWNNLFGTHLAAALLVALTLLATSPATAASVSFGSGGSSCSASASPNCTNFACLREKAADGTPGILTHITNTIKDVVGEASKKLYQNFIGNSQYQSAVNAAMALSVIIYGIAFMIGVVQPNFGQVLMRLIKMGIIFALISGTGWQFFNSIVVEFFNDGTDELIRGVIGIGTGITVNPGDSPFIQLDGLAKWILSPDMIIALMSLTLASGPYGLAVGGLMAFAVGGVIKLLVEALKVYGVSFIMRSLLLGVAPIFIVFMLFDRTKGLFTGWLNSLVNLSLQPILYFTFLSFFLVMIMTAATDMLGASNSADKPIEFCWAETGGVSGTTNKMAFWKVKFPNDNAPTTEQFDWNGVKQCFIGNDKEACKKAFPLNIIDILSFLILVYVAQRFAEVISRLSSDISNAFVNLDSQSKFDLGQKNAAAATAPAPSNQGTAGQSPKPQSSPPSTGGGAQR